VNKRVLLLAHGEFGLQIIHYLISNFPDDNYSIITVSGSTLESQLALQKIAYLSFDPDCDQLNTLLGANSSFDVGVCAWWPFLLDSSVLDLVRIGFLNVHPSLLPYLRGKHTSFWAIVEELPFGVTLHFLDSGVDTGPIIAQREIQTDWEDSGGTLASRAMSEGFDLFKEHYRNILEGKLAGDIQSLEKGNFHRSSEIIQKSKLDLRMSMPVRDILNLLRAKTHDSYNGCTFIDGDVTYEVRIEIRRL
jgi:methionyl-tRNA formyltransferase